MDDELLQAVKALENARTELPRQAIVQYKESVGFKEGLKRMGRITYEYEAFPVRSQLPTGSSRVADLGFPKHQVVHLDKPRAHLTERLCDRAGIGVGEAAEASATWSRGGSVSSGAPRLGATGDSVCDFTFGGAGIRRGWSAAKVVELGLGESAPARTSRRFLQEGQGCRPCPPYLCQVGRMTADPSMPMSSRLPCVESTTLVAQLSGGARTWRSVI
ncbi:hypothetical protein BHE74_00027246 [Ensete ventricosum]|nr:hypothetical protein BHE74_00027246 [Ensete ventricosum]